MQLLIASFQNTQSDIVRMLIFQTIGCGKVVRGQPYIVCHAQSAQTCIYIHIYIYIHAKAD
jgi:hypothetical protein